MSKRCLVVAAMAAFQVGAAHASFVLVGPSYSTTVAVNQRPGGAALELSGLFDTNFVLVNSNGTQSFTSNATINLSGPGGISFSSGIVDSGTVPSGSGYALASHSSLFDFVVALTPSQQALFQGNGATNVAVSLTNYSTTGPSSATAFYSWDVKNGSVNVVPLPAALPLLVAGVGAFGVYGRRRAPSRGKVAVA